MKIPFFIRLQCRKCGLQKYRLCLAHGGLLPPVYTRTLFITRCLNFKHEKGFEQREISTPKPEFNKVITTPIVEEKDYWRYVVQRRLRQAQRKPKPTPSPKQFKPRTAFEKRLWKKAKPEEDED